MNAFRRQPGAAGLRRKWLAMALILLQLIGLCEWAGTARANFAGGTGTVSDPYLIETAAQLDAIRSNMTAFYKLTADIDLDVAPYNQGTGWSPIGSSPNPFKGVLDGNGHTISNLKIARASDSNAYRQALFGVTQDATISRLWLKNVDVYAGSNFVGSLIGEGFNTTISEVSATGTVKAAGFAGGLVGLASSTFSITDSYFRGTVAAVSSVMAGGLVASSSGVPMNVTRSYAAAAVSAFAAPQATTGGLIGNYGTGSITSSYYDTQVSGMSDTGKGEPKSTAELKVTATYDGWDFSGSGVWRIASGKNGGYPYLTLQIPGLNEPPVAANVSVSGTAKLGETLSGIYTYSDSDNDPEGASLFKWYRADDASGANKSAISGATSSSYELKEADYGKFISFEVTPIAMTGPTTGTAAESARTSAVTEDPLPAPAALVASAEDRQVSLSWGGVTGATYYSVYIGTASGVYGSPITVTGTTYLVTGLLNDTTYYFVVKAGDARRASGYTNEASATPQAPTLTAISIRSGNAAPALARTGDTASLTFTANKPFAALPAVKIAGRTAEVTTVGTNVYAASLTFNGSESEGLVAFSIELSAASQVTATTDGSSLTFDKTAPSGTLSINNGAAETTSDSVALTIVWSDNLGQNGVRMRFSNDRTTWSSWEAAATAKPWTLSQGAVTKTVYMELKDSAGNTMSPAASATILRRNEDPQAPVLTAVSIKSDNAAPAFAKLGNTASLTFAAAKPLTVLPAVTIAGRSALVSNVGNNVYTASLTFNGSENEGIVVFAIELSPASHVTATTDGSALTFDKTAPSGTLSINNGALVTSTVSATLTIAGNDNGGANGVQMRFSNDSAVWSAWEPLAATKAWTLSQGGGQKTVYMELKDAAGNVSAPAVSAAITLRIESGGSGSSGTMSGSSSNSSQTESITVNVENSDKGRVISTVAIQRTTGADGRKTDTLALTPGMADKLVEQLKTAASSTAKLIIPDPKDDVSELNVTLQQGSTAKLADNKVNLEISAKDIRMIIPDGSLQGWKEDVYFRIVPVKAEVERGKAERRIREEKLVQEASGGAVIHVLGRPVAIETNMQNRPVTLIMPLGNTSLSEQQMKELAVYIEHSDGTKELVRGDIVPYDTIGTLGIRFTVTKFSTFAVVQLGSQAGTQHVAYITGYPDGTFGPDKPVTRAEMATMIVRLFGKDNGVHSASQSYSDVKPDHWAKTAIDTAAAGGLMDGYPDGSFKPEQTVTRAEMAAVAVRLSNAASNASSFPDVAGHWAAEAIGKAKAAGIVSGYEDGTFRPAQSMTRAEAVTILNKLAGRGDSSAPDAKWGDVSAKHWAYSNIQEASVTHTHTK